MRQFLRIWSLSLLPWDVKAEYTAIFINLQLKTEMQNLIPFSSFGGVRRRYQPFSYVKASRLFFVPLEELLLIVLESAPIISFQFTSEIYSSSWSSINWGWGGRNPSAHFPTIRDLFIGKLRTWPTENLNNFVPLAPVVVKCNDLTSNSACKQQQQLSNTRNRTWNVVNFRHSERLPSTN